MKNGIYKLYKIFAGDCLHDYEFQEIVSKFQYYPQLMEFLSGKYYTNDSSSDSHDKITSVNYLAHNMGINYCLLSRLQEEYSPYPYYLLYLFYDSFLMVVSIRINGETEKKQIIMDEALPVIIPYSRIKSLKVVESTFAYTSLQWRLEITYKNTERNIILIHTKS